MSVKALDMSEDALTDFLAGWHIDPEWSGSTKGGTYILTRHDAGRMARQLSRRFRECGERAEIPVPMRRDEGKIR